MCWYARVTFRCGCESTRCPAEIPNAAKEGFRFYEDSTFLLQCEAASVVNQCCPKYDIYPHRGFSTHVDGYCLGCLARTYQPKVTDEEDSENQEWEFEDSYSDELPAEKKQSAFHSLLNTEPTDGTDRAREVNPNSGEADPDTKNDT